jgi:hypothetical protein
VEGGKKEKTISKATSKWSHAWNMWARGVGRIRQSRGQHRMVFGITVITIGSINVVNGRMRLETSDACSEFTVK